MTNRKKPDEDTLFDVSRYSGCLQTKTFTRPLPKPMKQSNFKSYKAMFKDIREEIRHGHRQVLPITRIREDEPIKVNSFYMLRGILVYVNAMYDPITHQQCNESTRRNLKVHVIYENGRENHIKLVSFMSALYDKSREGKLITINMNKLKLFDTPVELISSEVSIDHSMKLISSEESADDSVELPPAENNLAYPKDNMVKDLDEKVEEIREIEPEGSFRRLVSEALKKI